MFTRVGTVVNNSILYLNLPRQKFYDMKIATPIVCAVFVLLTLSGFAQNKTDTPPPKASATEVREKITADYVSNMVKGDYEASRKDFAKTMDDAFSTERQKSKWLELTAKIGSFQKIEYTKEDKVGDNYQVKKRCQFTDQNISIILTFNEENQVIRVLYKL